MLNKTLNLPIHHIGVACKNLEKEREIFFKLGFCKKRRNFEIKFNKEKLTELNSQDMLLKEIKKLRNE